MQTPRPSRLLSLALLSVSPTLAYAGGSQSDEILSTTEMVPPTIIFVVDLSADMSLPCDGSASGQSCLSETLDVIDQTARHFDWASFGVVGTTSGADDDGFYPIAPVGSSYAEIASALSNVRAHSSSTRNLAEVVEAVAYNYLDQVQVGNGVDDDGDGFTGDWNETPVGYACSETHVVVLARGAGIGDDQIDSAHQASVIGDVSCSGVDGDCLLDNVASNLYRTDVRPSLRGQQNVVVHTVSLGVTDGSVADNLFQSVSDQTSGDGLYTSGMDKTRILGGLLSVLDDVQSGIYSRSTPVVSADGSYLIYSYYETTGDNLLARGHVRAYEVDSDPSSETYGQVVYEGPAEFGGALWDAGDLLQSRVVMASEANPGDMDGIGQRDIFFFEENAYRALGDMRSEADTNRRMSLDASFVDAVRANPAALDFYLNTTVDSANAPCAEDDAYDLDGNCQVDADDFQQLVNFVRGYSDASFKYLDITRGGWKLGDSPYSVPVVVTARDGNYSTDRSYQKFIDMLEADGVPSIVLLPANDGMLHAFRLEDDPATAQNEAGQELWAWVPGYLLLRDKDAEWANSLVDLMWYGRTALFDGSPVVEDVWIDDDGDGVKDCGPEACEWRRMVVVQQGMGGPVTLALDITNTQDPKFMWEQVNEADPTAMGYGTSRPVVFNAGNEDGSARWVAMWGSGRAADYVGSTNYKNSAEPNLYVWSVGSAPSYTSWGGESDSYGDSTFNIGNAHPDLTKTAGALQLDEVASDDNVEYGYISAALTVVDLDSNGTGDVAYFPVTTSYRASDESAGGVATTSSWMYKALINPKNPDLLTWCEFYDPVDGADSNGDGAGDGGIGVRPEVYHSATVAWHDSAEGPFLGVYWGTGSPFGRNSSTETGYFFAMADKNPGSCSYAQPIGDADGVYELAAGESLTSAPVVYAGVAYFSTYTADPNECNGGSSRVYGVRYNDFGMAGLDTDGDGDADRRDNLFIQADGLVQGVSVGQFGSVYYSTSAAPVDGSDKAIESIASVNDNLRGLRQIAWLEQY